MKVLIKNEKGLEREISPENIIISGKPLSFHLDQLNILQHEIRELKLTYAKDVEELRELWINLMRL